MASPRSVTTPITLNAMPDTPNTVITVGDTGGFSTETEDAFDNPTFQVRCRGPSALETRNQAFQIDAFFLNERDAFFIGDAWVLKVTRVGGRPSYLATDERGRTLYTSNYTITSER